MAAAARIMLPVEAWRWLGLHWGQGSSAETLALRAEDAIKGWHCAIQPILAPRTSST
jgi:hypothetical protein